MDHISQRALNRATLARQMLLERSDISALPAIERLVGLQAQAPTPPYFGLWSRLTGFRPDDLAGLIERREAVRIVAMRSTVHLLSAADALTVRPVLQPALERMLRSLSFGKVLDTIDLVRLIEDGRALVDAEPRTPAELAVLLGPQWPDLSAQTVQSAIRTYLALVQVPPRGLWGRSGRTALTTVETWLDRPLSTTSVDEVVTRYLGAFGPASVADAAAWSGLTRLGEVFDRLRPHLRTFTGPAGTTLYDLPDAPRPDEDSPAPARLIAEFDNLTLSYADRSRVLTDADRRRAFTSNGLIPGMILVDGVVAGVWRLRRTKTDAAVDMTAYRKISAWDEAAVIAEAGAMLTFAAPDATPDVTFTVID
jgi:hypothetical protein